ncbi:hypothetical protein FisN_19Hh176 [Fistulifera solaris]|uniref:High light inducible protein n=1 Tax=Fistulifera solaris TaxID=1519565 RepID=A0A1Z5K021_FISSO|nr:hypothetical protein FisN_19Hh176 [Fistulifera solaris]|eukprot:GAX19597.1 hypothetical protein FisN_19Hh176 [Fistulifera solaris]
MFRFIALLSMTVTCASAFVIPTVSSTTYTRLSMSDDSVANNKFLQDKLAQNPNMMAEPAQNPDRPELPQIPGDYNWDEKYAQDDDWISDPTQIPGKQVLSQEQIAMQAAALGKLEDKWRAQREMEEYEASINVGWVPTAELINGRTAMFFLVTGLLTEYWTGISLPGQVEEMLRVGGFIGFD